MNGEAYLFYPCHIPLLLLLVLLPLLARLVEATDEALDVALVPHAILVLLAGGRIVGDVGLAVFAEIPKVALSAR